MGEAKLKEAKGLKNSIKHTFKFYKSSKTNTEILLFLSSHNIKKAEKKRG